MGADRERRPGSSGWAGPSAEREEARRGMELRSAARFWPNHAAAPRPLGQSIKGGRRGEAKELGRGREWMLAAPRGIEPFASPRLARTDEVMPMPRGERVHADVRVSGVWRSRPA